MRQKPQAKIFPSKLYFKQEKKSYPMPTKRVNSIILRRGSRHQIGTPKSTERFNPPNVFYFSAICSPFVRLDYDDDDDDYDLVVLAVLFLSVCPMFLPRSCWCGFDPCFQPKNFYHAHQDNYGFQGESSHNKYELKRIFATFN